MNQTKFVFDADLISEDRKKETMTGHLCATASLMTMLKPHLKEAGQSISSAVIDNPGFYQ